MASATLYQQVLDPANRADPYPLYTKMRETPVAREPDGTYVVSTYREIVALLHDPRLSSDPHNHPEMAADPQQENPTGLPADFIRRDPPEHDRLRELATRPFGPPCSPGRIDGMHPWLAGTTERLIDELGGRDHADIVEDFAYRLPVAAICELLGVPLEDQPRFHRWADAFVNTFDPGTGTFAERQQERNRVQGELGGYLAGLIDARAARPGDDLISGMLIDTGPGAPMSRADLISTSVLLLVAGHETTVNLITNGMLTLLRHPEILDRLRDEPELSTRLVEELLRFEPPVQMLTNRSALADIDVAGTTIPKGAPMALMLAAGDRDPARFPDPDRFDPDRADNPHLGFGNGIHYCFGAPLARVEAQIALPALARRLRSPRLAADPPPYRPNPILRGPRHLPIELNGVARGR
ncbi:MAG TPA: cytochrome P450 [Dactylosporangium sp.]|jgi:cytochrome P450|nr:cytochrome P450 [Dactylosporangium sp.]